MIHEIMPHSDQALLAKLGVTLTPSQIRQASIEEARKRLAKKVVTRAAMTPSQMGQALASKKRSLLTQMKELRAGKRKVAASIYAVTSVRALRTRDEGDWDLAMRELGEASLCSDHPVTDAAFKLTRLSNHIDIESIPARALHGLMHLLDRHAELACDPMSWTIPEVEFAVQGLSLRACFDQARRRAAQYQPPSEDAGQEPV